MQCVGIPKGVASTAAGAFITEGKYKGIEFTELSEGETLEGALRAEGSSAQPSGSEYFYVEVPGGESGKVTRLLHRVPPGTRHPLQFGREVLCRLLQVPEKIQWKACMAGTESETAQALAFREAFKQQDFTLTL